jgi:hypothetical protein
MKIIITFFAALFLSASFYSQTYGVKWGELQKSGGRLQYVLPISGSNFYALRWAGGIFGSYRMTRHEDFAVSATGKLEMKVESGMASFEGVEVIDGKLLIFLSDLNDGKNHFFMQEYGKDLLPKGPSIQIAEYAVEKGRGRGSFSVISSRDNQFFGVVWEIPGKKDAKDRYGFKIMDNEKNEVSEGDYELPYEGKFSTINEHYLSNTGDYFLSVTEFEPSQEKKIFKNYANYKALHIFHVTPDDIEDMTVDLKGKRIEAMTMNSDNDKVFTIAGIYGVAGKAGVEGLFYLRANFTKKEIVDEGFEPFTKDFITQDWSDRQKEKAEKREAKGKGEPKLYNYVMRQTEVLKDGSIVGSLEQYYVVVTTYTDPKTGATRTTYTYYYNDVIAFKVGQDGGFDWLKKIDKSQVSTNDNGYLSSYARFVDNGNLCFIFNDNVNNYDESGKFVKGDRLYSASFSKKKNVVAIVEMDLESGEYERKTFFDRKEISAVAVPKLFNIDYNAKEMLLYAVYGKKERFGLLTFNN